MCDFSKILCKVGISLDPYGATEGKNKDDLSTQAVGLTLLIISDEDQFAKSWAKSYKHGEIITDFDLTCFIKNHCLDGDNVRKGANCIVG